MLNDYIHYNPVKIIFGKNSEGKVAKEIKALNCTKVLIHYDAGAFIKTLVSKVKFILNSEGLKVYELGGVEPNPKLSLMKTGCRMVKEHDIDFILAIGGGSTMDSAKYIACGTYYEGELWNHIKYSLIKSKVIKHGVIVTIPGTGSEVSTAAVWRDDTQTPEVKTCVFANEMRFDFVIINPELTYTIPKFYTAAACFDIISHCMEDYFSGPNDVEYYYYAYEGIVNEVIKNLRVVLKDPYNYIARSNICRVAYLPLDDNIISGTTHAYCVHNIEKPVTALFHRTHGEILAIMFLAWMKYCYKMNIPRFVRFFHRCFGAKLDYEKPENTIIEGINNLENFIEEIGLPTRLSQIEINDEMFEYCADIAIESSLNDYVGREIKLFKNDIINIYHLAK